MQAIVVMEPALMEEARQAPGDHVVPAHQMETVKMTSTLRERRVGAGDNAYAPNPSDAHLDMLAGFRSELEQLTATHRELLDELRSDGAIDLDADDSRHLHQENEELRALVAQLEQKLTAAPGGAEAWAERQSEYEKLLDEKSESIRTLNLKVQELQQAVRSDPSAPEVHDAIVAQMKAELQDKRRQLDEDEATVMQQIRTMEMGLSKDRADLARLRAELQRQQADFAREVEIASRDPQLRDRLAGLRRRQQDNAARKPAEASAGTSPTAAKSSGLIRRLFG